MSTSLKELARSFPKARGVFAYGSAAYQQPGLYRRMGANRYAPMLDMIFAADHPLAWHHEAHIVVHWPCAAHHATVACCHLDGKHSAPHMP